MKKMLIVFVMLFSLSMTAFADNSATCKISNSQENSTVVASLGSYDEATGVQTVYVSSDDSKPVSVIITIWCGTSSFDRSVTVRPAQNIVIKVQCPKQATEITIKGAKCE